MYTLASVRLLSFWLTATCSSAVKAYTYAYHTCVKRSRVYTFIHSCGRGNGARATRRLPNVYGHVMFHPRPSPFSMFPSPAQLNARTKSRNGEGLGPRLVYHHVIIFYTFLVLFLLRISPCACVGKSLGTRLRTLTPSPL